MDVAKLTGKIESDNAAEALLTQQLIEEDIYFEREYKAHPTRKWRSDFYLPDYNLLVEVDGILYNAYSGHQTGVGFQKDLHKHNESTINGYWLLRFTPAMVKGKAKDTIKGQRIEPAIDTIKRFIDSGIWKK